MAKSITVRYYINEETANQQGYPMRVVAVNAVDMPKEIFVFQRRVPSAMDLQERGSDDMFIKIAEPNALEEYPVEPPELPTEQPYYRQDEVTLYFRTMEELLETKTLIDVCIRGLVAALQAGDDLSAMEEVTYD